MCVESFFLLWYCSFHEKTTPFDMRTHKADFFMCNDNKKTRCLSVRPFQKSDCDPYQYALDMQSHRGHWIVNYYNNVHRTSCPNIRKLIIKLFLCAFSTGDYIKKYRVSMNINEGAGRTQYFSSSTKADSLTVITITATKFNFFFNRRQCDLRYKLLEFNDGSLRYHANYNRMVILERSNNY